MSKITVTKIRPVSWKIFVQGRENAEYVRQVLKETNIQTSDPEQQIELVEPRLFAFLATADEASPLTTEELEAIFERDDRIELGFEHP